MRAPQGGGGEEAAAAAAARLPPEPPAGEQGACSVAVRFPDGSRHSRRFPGGAPALRTLHDFCAAHSPEAAAGRAFALSESFPGACGVITLSPKTLYSGHHSMCSAGRPSALSDSFPGARRGITPKP